MDKVTFSMSLKENSRLIILASVDRGARQVKEVARLLNISTRYYPLGRTAAQGLAY